ncbi:MAG: sulfotransferase family 2 domain-containing protein [Pseudomonadota bacterium]
MTVHLEEFGLSYFAVPKCACSSLKNFFFTLTQGVTFAEAKAQGRTPPGNKAHVHQVYPSRSFADSASRSDPGWTHIAVVRDPVSRVVSCYANKIQQRNVLSEPETAERARAEGLSLTPSISEFVADIDGYHAVSSSLRHHSMPLSHFLGTDPSYFARIFALSELPLLVAMVAEHTGRDVPALPHVQRSGSKQVMNDISEADAAAIRDRFAEDIDLYGAWFAPAAGSPKSA